MDRNLPNLFLEEVRLATFKSWPFNDESKCNKKSLARAGFYKTGGIGDEDLVTCFLCGKELDGWETDDDPWEEHKSHAKYCLFAQIGKAEEDLKIAELLKIFMEYEKNFVTKTKEYNIDFLNDMIREFEFKSRRF